MIQRAVGWIDGRLGTASLVRTALRKAFPDHWSFMLGELNVYCFVILVATGTYLTFFFDPQQPYPSVIRLSFDVNAGLLVRQVHHWTALVFVAGIALHMARVFFTGAFRRPRELTWLLGVALLGACIFEGFAGYSLPGDLLSGLGLRIADSVAISIPLVGTWISSLALGGAFPSAEMIPRLFVLHVYLLPIGIATLIGAHLALVWRQKHTQFRGPGRTEGNVVGSPLVPNYALRSMALGAGTLAVMAALGALIEINPVWEYGPYVAWQAISPAQPDWFLGWLEGALRIGPPFALQLFGHTIPPAFWPGALLPGLAFGVFFGWPWLERLVSRDAREHQLLDRARDAPLRTAVGTAVLAGFVVLTFAGSDDVQATYGYVSVIGLTEIYRALAVAVPIVAGLLAYAIARGLPRGGPEQAERTRIVRNPRGGYDEERIP